ncbi:sensor histidine kinase [Luteimicrobium xylanilyticum]
MDVLEARAARWFEPDAVGFRQAPFTIGFAVVLVTVVVDPAPSRPVLLAVSAVLVAGVQLVGSLGPWQRWPRSRQDALALTQMAALVVLELGSGEVTSFFNVLLFLPVVGLALQPGARGLVLAVVGVLVVSFVPVLVHVARPEAAPPTTRAIVVVLIGTFVAIGSYGITERLRERTEALAAARDELAVMAERLRGSRDLMQSMVAAATEQAVIGTDRDGKVVACSPGAGTVLGREVAEIMEADVVDLFDADQLRERRRELGLPDDATSRERAIMGVAVDGKSERREWTFTLPDGTARQVELVITPRPALDVANGEGGYLIVGTDVTEERRAQRLQDEFVGLVSHELRTPLSSILGYVDLLRLDADGLSDEQLGYVDVVDRNAHRLLRLVNDLLLGVQVAAGTFELAAERTDASEVVRRSVANLAPTADAAGVDVTVDVPERMPFVSDPERLGQVVENILANAVKFTPRGGQVRVSLRRGADVTVLPPEGSDPPGPDDAWLSVADDGPGMTRDEVRHVSERFFRARSAQRKRVSGLGLGLPIVATIVEAHGGYVDIDSTPGAGTTVVVDLRPLAPARGTPPGRAS